MNYTELWLKYEPNQKLQFIYKKNCHGIKNKYITKILFLKNKENKLITSAIINIISVINKMYNNFNNPISPSVPNQL